MLFANLAPTTSPSWWVYTVTDSRWRSPRIVETPIPQLRLDATQDGSLSGSGTATLAQLYKVERLYEVGQLYDIGLGGQAHLQVTQEPKGPHDV